MADVFKITKIEITHHQLPLDPPFPASWDTQPRTKFPATIVRVHDNAGHVGIGSGDAMYGFADYQRYFVGEDPLALARHNAVLSNIEFHAGRPWPVDSALWDLAGKILNEPVWKMVGGVSNRIRTYASSGVHRPVDQMVEVARRALEMGFPALKVRFGRPSLNEDLGVLAAIRAEVGNQLELMVDCNQGWRMPWDIQAPWNLKHALEVAQELQALSVYWMEEPLHRGDYDGYAALRKQARGLRIAGGEMTREPYEFRELLTRGGLDVFQPDCVCSMGIGGLKDLAVQVVDAGHIFTPHTWGNGIGVLANAHLTAGTVGTAGAHFLEYPLDGEEWSLSRRDYPLLEPVRVDAEGYINLSDAPGLGFALNEDLLRRTHSQVATFA